MTAQSLDEELIFNVARKIESQEARSSYLDQVCSGNAPLRARIQALLRVSEQDGTFLKSPPGVAGAAAGGGPSDSGVNAIPFKFP